MMFNVIMTLPDANSELYLLTEDICHAVDNVVALAPRLQRVLASLSETGQEMAV